MKIIGCHSALTNGTAGLLISLMTVSETAVPIRIGSISLYFPDCLFGEDRRRQQSSARLHQRQVHACAHRGLSMRNVPPQQLEDFGIFILNSCDLVKTSGQI